MTEKEHDDANDVWLGVGLVLLLHLLQVPLAFLTSFFSVMLVGLSQLLYILPAILIYIIKGRPGMVNGLILGSAITFLLNAACAVLVFVKR